MNAPRQSWMQWIIVALVACLAIFVWEALSDEPPAADRPHKIPVAVVDVAKVFKQFRNFNERVEVIKSQITEFEAEVRKRSTEFKEAAEESPSEASIAKATQLQKSLEADVAAKRETFLADETRIYFDSYQMIEKVIRQICRDRDIGLVFRCNGNTMLPGDRKSVLEGVNRAVIYADVPDLSDDVIAAINASHE